MKLRNLFSIVWTRVWLVSSCVLFIAVGLVFLKFCEESSRGRERGALVSSIVEQQFHQLTSGLSDPRARLMQFETLPYSHIDLKRWVIRQVFLPDANPIKLGQQIDLMKNSRSISRSSSIRVALERWSNTLHDWEVENRNAQTSQNGFSEDLIREGRQRYFEAAGFRKIGRTYDATILNLWTISLLTRFIHQNPYDSFVPEALFMLGVAYVSLGRALPPQMRGDRILNLCSELYPDSLWANRSDAVWREAYGDEI